MYRSPVGPHLGTLGLRNVSKPAALIDKLFNGINQSSDNKYNIIVIWNREGGGWGEDETIISANGDTTNHVVVYTV